MAIKSFLGADSIDEWRPKALTCSWGGDSGDSGGYIGDSGGGYNSSDFGGDYSGNFGDAFSGADYSGGFDGGSFNGGGFDSGQTGGFDNGGGVSFGDAGVGFNGFGSGDFGGSFDTSGGSGGFGGSFSGSDNIGGSFDSSYGGGPYSDVGTFGTGGGWQDAVSDAFNAGPGITGYMSGDMSAPGWGQGSYGAYGGFGGAQGGPFGPASGGIFSTDDSSMPSAAQYNQGTMNGATIHGPSNPGIAEDLLTLSGRDPGDPTGANVVQGSRAHFDSSFPAQANNPFAGIDLSGGQGFGTPGGLGGGQSANPYTVEGKDQSQFVPAQPGLLTNDPSNFFASPAFGWGPMSTLAASQGPYIASGTGLGAWGPFADTGKGDNQLSFEARAGGHDFSPSVGNFDMAEAHAFGDQGRAGENTNITGGYPISPGAEQYALTAGDLRADSPGLLGGNLGYDLGARADTFDSRFGGPWANPVVSQQLSASPDIGRDTFDSRFGGPYAPATQWTSGMTLSDKGDNSRDTFDSRFGAWGPPTVNEETQQLAPWEVGLPRADPRDRSEHNPQDILNQDQNYPIYDFNETLDPSQNMGRPNAYPSLAEFMGPGRGQSQNISRDSSLQVTVPGRVAESSRGVSAPFGGGSQGRSSQMDALLAQARTAPTQAGRIAALDALNGLISANYGRGPNQSVGRGPYGGDPDPFIAQMLRMGR